MKLVAVTLVSVLYLSCWPAVRSSNDGSGVFEDVTSTQLPVGKQKSLGVPLGNVRGRGDLVAVFANTGSEQPAEQCDRALSRFRDCRLPDFYMI